MKEELKNALKKELSPDIESEVKKQLTSFEKTLKAVNGLPDEISADQLKEWKSKYESLETGFDALQTQFKEFKMAGPANRSNNPFADQLTEAVKELKQNIKGDSIKGGSFVKEIELKAVGDMTIAANLTGSIRKTYRDGIGPLPLEMLHRGNLVAVPQS